MAKKLYPVNRLDIAHMEHWLADLAEEGFSPTHFGSFFVTGKQDVPQKATYRFIPLGVSDKRTEPTVEEAELFSEAGWEFINHLDERFLVFQNKEDYPKEVPLPDEIQQERFQSLAKRFQKEYIFGVTLTIIALGFFVFIFLHNFHEFILFEEAFLEHFSLLLFLLTLPFGRGITRKSLHHLKSYGEDMKNLAFDREEEVITSTPRLFVSAMHAFSGILAPILGIAILLGIFYDFDDNWVSINQTNHSMPQISLEELTGGTVEYQESSYKEEYTIFAPTQYSMKQTGFATPSMEEIILYWHYYEVISSELAEITFAAWMASDGGTPLLSDVDVDEEEKISLDTDLMDKAYIHSVNDGWTSFWFLEDNVIVSGEYIGGGTDVIVENLDLFADVME